MNCVDLAFKIVHWEESFPSFSYWRKEPVLMGLYFVMFMPGKRSVLFVAVSMVKLNDGCSEFKISKNAAAFWHLTVFL